jgi:hypothetical protein
MAQTIPKRIIHIWVTPEGQKRRPIPARYQRLVRRMRALNPDFEYLCLDDEILDQIFVQHYPELLEVFRGLTPWVSRTDLARLVGVHHMGGFYFDLDVMHLRPLGDLLENTCLFPYETQVEPFIAASTGMLEAVGNFAIAAVPGHPFIKACIDQLVAAFQDPDSVNLPSDEVVSGFSPLSPTQTERRQLYSTSTGMITSLMGRRSDLQDQIRVVAAIDARNGHKIPSAFGHHAQHLCDGTWRGGNGGLLLEMLRRAWVRRQRWQIKGAACQVARPRCLTPS